MLSRQSFACLVASAITLIVTSYVVVFPPITYSALFIAFFVSLMAIRGNIAVKNINTNSFKVERILSKELCSVNEEIQVMLKITNKAKEYLYIKAVDNVNELRIERGSIKVEKLLAPSESIELRYVVKAGKRGAYKVGPLKIAVFDRHKYGMREIVFHNSASYIYVYPMSKQIIRLSDMLLYAEGNNLFGSAGNYITGTEDTFRTLREYEYGDSAKRIYWKKSGKNEDQIFVREYDKLNRLEIHFLIDCSPSMWIGDEPNLLDEVITNLTPLIWTLIRKGDYVLIKTLGAVNNIENMRISTSLEYRTFIKKIAELKPKEDYKLLSNTIKIRHKPDVLIIISRFAYLTADELRNLMTRLNKQGIHSYLILVRKKIDKRSKISELLEEIEDKRIEKIRKICPSIIIVDSKLLALQLCYVLNSMKRRDTIWIRR